MLNTPLKREVFYFKNMAGSKAIKINCPNCKSPKAAEIWFKGNHGEEDLLEKHCNQCGWAVDGEGVLRRKGREVNELGQFLDTLNSNLEIGRRL